MLRILSLAFLLFALSFGAFEEQIRDFDAHFITAKNDAQIKFHQQLKSLYIQSVINEDTPSKIEILKRLLISTNTLGLDDQSYAEELRESGVHAGGIEALRRAALKDVKLEGPRVQKPVFSAESGEQNLILAKAVKNKLQGDKIRILSHKKLAGGVELRLNAALNLKEVKSFSLDEKGNYRYIMDFDAILEGGRRDYAFGDFSVVLSQYNPTSVRIVVRSGEKIAVNFKQEGMLFSVFAAQKPAPKRQESKPPQASQKQASQEKIPPHILSIDKKDSGVVLNSNKALGENDLSTSSMRDSKFFRQIVSFEGVLEGNRRSFSFGRNVITITQYNPKIVRIVLSSPQPFKLFKRLEGKNLALAFEAPHSAPPAPSKVAPSKNQEKSTLNSQFKAGKAIVIDAGHGGKDSGALSDKKGSLKEKDVVLSAALKLGAELKKRGYKVFYTRSTDKFINLRDRTKIANDKRADLFLSIHANAAANASRAKNSEGLETFFLSPARSERSKKAAEKENQGDFEDINHFSKQSILNFLNREKIIASNKLAIDIQKGVLTRTRPKFKVVDGGVREAPFWVLVGASMPAILLEIGYITHPIEGRRIADKNFQELLAKGVADGVDNYFYHNR